MGVNVEFIARQCHEANRAYCQSLGDKSQPGWKDAPEWQKESAMSGVRLHLTSNISPAESHYHWMKHKLADGWTYGPVKDADKKQHPCLVVYDDLPQEQRTKDYIFRAIVHTYKG